MVERIGQTERARGHFFGPLFARHSPSYSYANVLKRSRPTRLAAFILANVIFLKMAQHTAFTKHSNLETRGNRSTPRYKSIYIYTRVCKYVAVRVRKYVRNERVENPVSLLRCFCLLQPLLMHVYIRARMYIFKYTLSYSDRCACVSTVPCINPRKRCTAFALPHPRVHSKGPRAQAYTQYTGLFKNRANLNYAFYRVE